MKLKLLEIRARNFTKKIKCGPIFKEGNKLILLAQITPNSSKSRITSIDSNYVCINIKAPAENNKANQELVNYISDIILLSKHCITIVKGKTSKTKEITVNNAVDEVEIYYKLLSAEIKGKI